MKRSGYHVLLAVPTRGSICWQTVTRLEEIRDGTPGLRPILYQAGNLSVAQTRNAIVTKFLATDCEVLVMVDDDIVPPPQALTRMLPELGQHAMVSIPHPMPLPSDPGRLVLSAFTLGKTGKLQTTELYQGINQVAAVATGCVAINRRPLEQLGPHPFWIPADPDAEMKSDDFQFCEALREYGHKIGCVWDGWPCDHIRAVGLGPLLEGPA